MSVVYLNHTRQRYGPDDNGPLPVTIWEVDVKAETADATATYLTVQSDVPLGGAIRRVDVQPNTALAQDTVITVYETSSALTTAINFASITQAAANAAKTIYPVVQSTDNTGTAVTGAYQPNYFSGYLTLKLSTNFIADNRVIVRVYIETMGG